MGPQGGTALKAPIPLAVLILRLFRHFDVKTNSTLLQSALHADFALYFAENGI
jgi:hypothetical protein